jgi:hypothetical protein
LFSQCAYGVFSNFLAVSQKESSTLLQLREILLRTVGCTGVLLSLSIARKYSVLQQTGGDTSFFATLYLIGFVFEGHCIPSFINFSLLLDWNC